MARNTEQERLMRVCENEKIFPCVNWLENYLENRLTPENVDHIMNIVKISDGWEDFVSNLKNYFNDKSNENNNEKVRKAIFLSRLKKYQIANKLGVTVYTFSHWLQTDLNDERTQRICKAIQELAEKGE